MMFISSQELSERVASMTAGYDSEKMVKDYIMIYRNSERGELGMLYTCGLNDLNIPDLIITAVPQERIDTQAEMLRRLINQLVLLDKTNLSVLQVAESIECTEQHTVVKVNNGQWFNGFGLNCQRFYTHRNLDDLVYVQLVVNGSTPDEEEILKTIQVIIPTTPYGHKGN